jgi:hypothetical protein
MQVVKSKLKNMRKILLIIVCSISLSCSNTKSILLPTNNLGGYTIVKQGSTELDNLRISIIGKVYDISNKNPISGTVIKMGCYQTITKSDGSYKFELTKGGFDVPVYLSAISIGYKSIETKIFDLVMSSNFEVNFYLSEDDRPLYNCEGNQN